MLQQTRSTTWHLVSSCIVCLHVQAAILPSTASIKAPGDVSEVRRRACQPRPHMRRWRSGRAHKHLRPARQHLSLAWAMWARLPAPHSPPRPAATPPQPSAAQRTPRLAARALRRRIPQITFLPPPGGTALSVTACLRLTAPPLRRGTVWLERSTLAPILAPCPHLCTP